MNTSIINILLPTYGGQKKVSLLDYWQVGGKNMKWDFNFDNHTIQIFKTRGNYFTIIVDAKNNWLQGKEEIEHNLIIRTNEGKFLLKLTLGAEILQTNGVLIALKNSKGDISLLGYQPDKLLASSFSNEYNEIYITGNDDFPYTLEWAINENFKTNAIYDDNLCQLRTDKCGVNYIKPLKNDTPFTVILQALDDNDNLITGVKFIKQ